MPHAMFQEDLHFAELTEGGRQFAFLLNSRADHIQQFLARGEFYEREELELICRHAGSARRFLDVGANIGNHSIYLAHRLQLERVVPIEPQPSILNILKANIGLNWLPCFDLSFLGLGLSDAPGWARIGRFAEDNIGGTRLVPSVHDTGDAPAAAVYDIPLRAADQLFRQGDFDLIKIDVEGLEIAVLKGMTHMLEAFDGIIFLEVHDDNAAQVADVVSELGFKRRDTYRRYQRCENWILGR